MRMRVGVVGLVLMLGTPMSAPVAEAASFDCAKASTPLERLICSTPELSRSDEVLAKAYATALGGLSEAAKAVVQSSQRDWLAYALICAATSVLVTRGTSRPSAPASSSGCTGVPS